MRTRLTDLVGIDRPIVLAPMTRSTGGALAAAVSEAGGLGTFGGALQMLRTSPRYIERELAVLRARTDRPFGVGFITSNLPHLSENFELVLEAGVPVLLFAFGDPRPWLPRARNAGRLTICLAQSMDDARMAIDAGADVIAVQGNEAGGHTGRANLLPFLVEALDTFPDTPILAAGGISTGRGLAAVLAAGADGAWIGSAFLPTEEATEVPEQVKLAMVNAGYGDTIFSRIYDIVNEAANGDMGWPEGVAVRTLRNAFTERWHGAESDLMAQVPEVVPAYLEAIQDRDLGQTPVGAGEGTGAITAILPVGDVIDRICTDAARLLADTAARTGRS